ncbi:MAG: AAA family ATPase, partial [Candidatus Sulfotelmatobacter sp.]
MPMIKSQPAILEGQEGSEYVMIESLTIENFRCFEKTTISDLRRVNVVVGNNGAGKTALLVDCRKVTITSCYASKLVWRQTAKCPSPATNVR